MYTKHTHTRTHRHTHASRECGRAPPPASPSEGQRGRWLGAGARTAPRCVCSLRHSRGLRAPGSGSPAAMGPPPCPSGTLTPVRGRSLAVPWTLPPSAANHPESAGPWPSWAAGAAGSLSGPVPDSEPRPEHAEATTGRCQRFSGDRVASRGRSAEGSLRGPTISALTHAASSGSRP